MADAAALKAGWQAEAPAPPGLQIVSCLVDRLSGRGRKCPSAPAVGPLRAGHTCNRSALCRCAIFEIAPCGGNGFLACARKRLPPPVRGATAPRINLCPGSNGSGLLASDVVLRWLRPSFSKR